VSLSTVEGLFLPVSPRVQRFRDHHAGDPSGAKAFEAVVGRSVAEANDEWVRWASGSKLRVLPARVSPRGR
jgi:hypothetical protein